VDGREEMGGEFGRKRRRLLRL
jgi:hypothetical protein